MAFKPTSIFQISDDLFFKIFFIFSLIVGGSLIFWSIQFRLENEDNAIEEDNTIEQLEEIEIKTNNNSGYIHNVNCDSPVWKKRDRCN